VKRGLAFLSHLIFSILFCSLGQNLYAQNRISNPTLKLDFDSANATRNSINELRVATNSSHKLRVISTIFPIDKFIKKLVTI